MVFVATVVELEMDIPVEKGMPGSEISMLKFLPPIALKTLIGAVASAGTVVELNIWMN